MYHDEIDDDTLRKAEAECMERPSNSAMWDERLYTTHGPVMAWAERGDDVLSESNYLRVLEDLQAVAAQTEHEDRDCCWDEAGKKIGWGLPPGNEPHADDVIDATISDWLVGSLRQLFVRVRDDEGEFTPTFREAVRINLALRDYPVYDESDFSEREWEAAETLLNMALTDARHTYEVEVGDDISDELDAEVCAAVREDPDGWVQCYMPEVSWDEIASEYAKQAESRAHLALEAYARTLIPTQPETLFD